MPSTLVHVALAGLLAAALLGAAYDLRALAVVLGVTAAADLDALSAFVYEGGHRALFHTFLIPLGAALLLWVDVSLREESAVLDRYGRRALRIAWVSILAYAIAAIGLDFVTNGVNALYPLHDQFYVLDGKIDLSTKDGIVQTFIETGGDAGGGGGGGGGGVPAPESVGSTENVTYTTGVNPESGGGVEPASVERTFPIVGSGWELLVVVSGAVATVARFGLPDVSEE